MVRGAKRALTLLTLAFAVASCGGGGGGSEMPTPPPVALSGTLDTSYGTDGRIVVPQGFNGFVFDRSGNLFVGGGAILKYDSAGRPAADFVDGAPSTPGSSRVVAVDPSGNVYAFRPAANPAWVLAKRDASGKLAASFGQAGLVDLNSLRAINGSDDVFVDAMGNIYVQGQWSPPLSAGPIFLFIMKLDATGRAVTSFGSRGDGTLDLSSGAYFPTARTVDDAGNLYATAPANAAGVGVVAFDANGKPAASFSTAPVPVPCTGALLREPTIERDAKGDIYVGTTCGLGDSREHALVVKLDAAGNPVTTFGTAAAALDFVSAGPGSTAIAALQPAADGGVYVAAYDPANECGGIAVAKLGVDGKLVDAFAEHGVKRMDLAVGVTMAVDSAGRLYLAGRDRPTICPRLLGTQISFSVYRLNG